MNRWGPAGSWPSPSTGSVRPFSRRRLASLVAGSALVADLRQHPIVRQTYAVLGPLDFRSTGQHHDLSCILSSAVTKVFRPRHITSSPLEPSSGSQDVGRNPGTDETRGRTGRSLVSCPN